MTEEEVQFVFSFATSSQTLELDTAPVDFRDNLLTYFIEVVTIVYTIYITILYFIYY